MWFILIDINENGQQEDITNQHNATNQLLGERTWIALTCLAVVMGYVIGEDIGLFTGALCAIVIGVLCIGVILWGYR